MAAPENSPTILCSKCFATVERSAPFCPECGIPMGSIDGSDAEIYPMLARANLLRMRGEYNQAEEVSLRILKRYPNNSTANTLLGDICAERGDLEHSAEWYEMALDVSPDSKVDREKLAAIKRRIQDRDTAATAAQIGLPDRKGSKAIPMVLAIVLMAAVGAGAYFFGANAPTSTGARNVVDVSGGGVIDSGSKADGPGPASAEAKRWVDLDSVDKVKVALGDQGSAVLDAWEHPVTHEFLVTINADGQTDARRYAAILAARIIEKTGAAAVMIRAVQSDQQVFVGKVAKADFDALMASVIEGQDPYAAPDVADRLLSPGEWPPKADPTAATSGSTGSEPVATTGSGETGEASSQTTGAEAATTGATTGQ